MSKLSKSKSRRGAEELEFTFALLPLLVMVFVLLDASWGIFVKSTLAYAVHAGVRAGITITGTQAGSSNLTYMVKRVVQRNALGLLGTLDTDTRFNLIKVHYFLPPAKDAFGPTTDVSTLANGNAPLNIMQVSIQGFSLRALVPRMYSWRSGNDNASTPIGAVAADLIEPSRDPPAIGLAP